MYYMKSFSGRPLCVGEESQLHYCQCCHSRLKVVRTCRLFCSHYPCVLFSQCQYKDVAVRQTPKVASQWQVLACTRRQLARYIVVVVVHQTYDLCVCWRPMPAEPAESQKQRQTLERSFLMQILIFQAALPSCCFRIKKNCSQCGGSSGKDSVASKLNQVEEGKGGSAGCSRTEQQQQKRVAAAAVEKSGSSSRKGWQQRQ